MRTDVHWGMVTGVSPVEVRFTGDTVSSPVGLKDSALTLTTNDQVLLARVGSDSWVIVCKIAAT